MTGGGTKYKNTKDLVALEATEFFGKNFLISDTMEMPQWELGSETKNWRICLLQSNTYQRCRCYRLEKHEKKK